MKILKIFLSVFLCFHLFAIALAPNSSTYLGSRTSFLVYPYVSFLELGSQWGFFAPDPGPPPIFFEYEVIGSDGQVLVNGSWPGKNESYFLRERMNRRIAIARFWMVSFPRARKMLSPYLCRQYPTATSVRIWRLFVHLPNLNDVVAKKRYLGDTVDSERKFVGQDVCEPFRELGVNRG